MTSWIIDDCQPLYILRFQSFKMFMGVACPGFNIPGDDKIRRIINDAFVWSTEQLTSMLQSARSVCITTDLWSSRNDEPYIGVTAGWLWSLKEALLACEKINGKYTGENIQNAIEQIIERFQLKQKLFVATTDNGANVMKAIRLMEILHVPCCAHTLHLSVIKGLGATGAFKKRVTNLILFFKGSPKQTENLRDAQRNLNYPKIYEVLLDVKTRWNSTYLAWNCLYELKNAIIYLITILKISQDKDDKDNGDYLEQINLTESEWK